MPLTVPSLSRETIRVPVFADIGGVQISLSDTTVEFAFKANNVDPVGADWVAGAWEYNPSTTVYYATCLIGPGTPSPLADGRHDVWIRITTTDEVVVRNVGVLLIS